MPLRLSIVIPAFNEAKTLELVFGKLEQALQDFNYEVVVVDDGSTDDTAKIIEQFGHNWVIVCSHSLNQGKGAALRTAFQKVNGEIIVIQDADLEYDPSDIPNLVQPILDGHADAVFGSRFHGKTQRIHLYWHRVANTWLTWLTNVLFNLDLSDMETGYKAIRKIALEKITIRENRFGVEPELTAKLAKHNCRIYEVPISYYGRDYADGKKIGFRDAVWAAWCIIRYRIAD